MPQVWTRADDDALTAARYYLTCALEGESLPSLSALEVDRVMEIVTQPCLLSPIPRLPITTTLAAAALRVPDLDDDQVRLLVQTARRKAPLSVLVDGLLAGPGEVRDTALSELLWSRRAEVHPRADWLARVLDSPHPRSVVVASVLLLIGGTGERTERAAVLAVLSLPPEARETFMVLARDALTGVASPGLMDFATRLDLAVGLSGGEPGSDVLRFRGLSQALVPEPA